MTAIRLNVNDLEALPEGDGNRYELIDGELYVTRQPRWSHQVACMRISAALDAWSRQSGRGFVSPAPGVILTDEDAVAPDVVWLSSERASALDPDSGKLTAAPDLAVEVLSPGMPNEKRDRTLKLDLYSRHGVKEYWIVDWRNRSIQVYRRANAALSLTETLYEDDQLTSPLLPGFSARVADLMG